MTDPTHAPDVRLTSQVREQLDAQQPLITEIRPTPVLAVLDDEVTEMARVMTNQEILAAPAGYHLGPLKFTWTRDGNNFRVRATAPWVRHSR